MEHWKKKLGSCCKNVLYLKFADTENITDPQSPKKKHIDQIMSFAKTLFEKKVLIHCKMGISRSTATAIIVLMTLGHDYESAKKHVYSIRSIANPNTLMIGLYDGSIKECDLFDIKPLYTEEKKQNLPNVESDDTFKLEDNTKCEKKSEENTKCKEKKTEILQNAWIEKIDFEKFVSNTEVSINLSSGLSIDIQKTTQTFAKYNNDVDDDDIDDKVKF